MGRSIFLARAKKRCSVSAVKWWIVYGRVRVELKMHFSRHIQWCSFVWKNKNMLWCGWCMLICLPPLSTELNYMGKVHIKTHIKCLEISNLREISWNFMKFHWNFTRGVGEWNFLFLHPPPTYVSKPIIIEFLIKLFGIFFQTKFKISLKASICTTLEVMTSSIGWVMVSTGQSSYRVLISLNLGFLWVLGIY